MYQDFGILRWFYLLSASLSALSSKIFVILFKILFWRSESVSRWTTTVILVILTFVSNHHLWHNPEILTYFFFCYWLNGIVLVCWMIYLNVFRPGSLLFTRVFCEISVENSKVIDWITSHLQNSLIVLSKIYNCPLFKQFFRIRYWLWSIRKFHLQFLFYTSTLLFYDIWVLIRTIFI